MTLNGIVLYDIESDGCLNGVFTNQPSNGIIYNEMARKKAIEINPDNRLVPWDIAGDYDCLWLDEKSTPAHRKLVITHNSGFYEVEWFNGSKSQFKGIGYLMNSRQFVVRYDKSE